MHSLPKPLRSLLLAGMALAAIACSTPDEEKSPVGNVSGIVKNGEFPVEPLAAASLKLPNGNTLEFHDFDGGALLIESGEAGINSAFTDEESPAAKSLKAPTAEERISGVWKAFAPNRPLPLALAAMQVRWKGNRLPAAPAKPTLFEGFGPSIIPQAGSPLAKSAAPVGCNNGCCDFQWLSTLSQCKRALDYNWFYYNAGYSWQNANGIDIMDGLVCAANGISQWKMNINGSGGSWPIQPAHYKRWWWIAGIFDQDMRSSVNSAASQALHTYCGDVSF
jgi:hypothetical protein